MFGKLLKIPVLCCCLAQCSDFDCYQTAELKVKVTTDVVITHLGFPLKVYDPSFFPFIYPR